MLFSLRLVFPYISKKAKERKRTKLKEKVAKFIQSVHLHELLWKCLKSLLRSDVEICQEGRALAGRGGLGSDGHYGGIGGDSAYGRCWGDCWNGCHGNRLHGGDGLSNCRSRSSSRYHHRSNGGLTSMAINSCEQHL